MKYLYIYTDDIKLILMRHVNPAKFQNRRTCNKELMFPFRRQKCLYVHVYETVGKGFYNYLKTISK